MNDDFVEILALQLRDAAERAHRRGSLARRWATARAALPRVAAAPALAAVAVTAILVVTIFALIAVRSDRETPASPRVVARFAPATSLGAVVPGFGSAWLADPNGGQVLRVDPGTRRVTARVGVAGVTSISVGDGAVWAIGVGSQPATTGPLLRIDPRTNRVGARIPVPATSRSNQGLVVATPGAIWVIGPSGAVLFDPRTNRPTRTIGLPATQDATGSAALAGDDLWILRDDGAMLRFDARTGARLQALRSPPKSGTPFDVDGALLVVGADAVRRLDPATGRVVWRTRALARGGPGAVAGGRLWVETSDPGRVGDRLVALEPRTGRIVASVHVGEFGAVDLHRVGSDLWMINNSGRVVVVKP